MIKRNIDYNKDAHSRNRFNRLVIGLLTLTIATPFSAVYANKSTSMNPSLIQQMTKTAQTIAKKNSLPAFGVLKVNADGSFHYAAVGKRGDGEAVSKEAAWHIGSITKSMTATLALLLIEDGVIELTTTPEEIWPDIEIHASLKGITLHELLTHTSGISGDTGKFTSMLKRIADKRPLNIQRTEWVQSMLSVEAEVKRGEFVYSNNGYILAGAMLETAAGLPYETLLDKRLFKPLNMEKAGFGAPSGDDAIWGHKSIFFYQSAQEPGLGADNPAALGPAGTVHLSLKDMAKYIKLHLGFYPDVLSDETRRQLHKPVSAENYALGWKSLKRPWANGAALHHSGSNTMWLANLWLAPNKKEGYFAVTNVMGKKAFMATDKIIGELIKM